MPRSSYRKSKLAGMPLYLFKPRPPSLALTNALDAIPYPLERNSSEFGHKSSAAGGHIAAQIQAVPNFGPALADNSFLFNAEKKLEFALGNSYTLGTSKQHGNAVKRFLKFAASCGFSEAEALPCTESLLCLWIAQGVGKTGVGTATANIAAIASWHRVRGMRFEAPAQMTTIKRAIKLHWPIEKQQKPIRPPISPRMMRLLVAAWCEGSSRELCALAVALAAFIGQMRLGELVPAKASTMDRSHHPTRGVWSPCDDGSEASTIFLPWTKTTCKAGALVTLPSQLPPLDPTWAICRHLIESPLPDDAMFCEFLEGSKVVIMDKDILMEMCNSVWAADGIQRITGHSFRIGGTTSLLLAGVDVEIVKGMGRWSSDAFKRYWRKVEKLFARHASSVIWTEFDI